MTETFSFARLRKSSLADVGVRGLPAETEDAELWRNLGGGVILGGAGMLFLPRLGVRDLPTNAMVLDAEVGVWEPEEEGEVLVWLTEGAFLNRKGELVRGFEELDAIVYPATMWHELMMMIRNYREDAPMWNNATRSRASKNAGIRRNDGNNNDLGRETHQEPRARALQFAGTNHAMPSNRSTMLTSLMKCKERDFSPAATEIEKTCIYRYWHWM